MMELDPTKTLEQLGATATLISVAVGDRRNLLTVTRVACVSNEPPLMAVSIATKHYSFGLIKEAGEFVVNIARADQSDLLTKAGKVSGRDGDKFNRLGIETVPARKVRSPLVAGAAANIECKLVNAVEAGDHVVFIGEVVALHVDENVKPLMRLRGEFYELRDRV